MKKICKDGALLEKYKNNEFHDKVSLTACIGNILVDVMLGVPVLTIAVLIVRIGLEKFCSLTFTKNKYTSND